MDDYAVGHIVLHLGQLFMQNRPAQLRKPLLMTFAKRTKPVHSESFWRFKMLVFSVFFLVAFVEGGLCGEELQRKISAE